MAFGLMMIWNWVVGLVLFFPVCGLVYYIFRKKFGKDIMDRVCSDGDVFDMRCLWILAIIGLVWEAAYPIMFYLIYMEAKELHNMMHE